MLTEATLIEDIMDEGKHLFNQLTAMECRVITGMSRKCNLHRIVQLFNSFIFYSQIMLNIKNDSFQKSNTGADSDYRNVRNVREP